MSKHFNYYDDWKSAELSCDECNIKIMGRECPNEYFDELFELNCPQCSKILGLVSHPTVEESRANWDKLSDLDKKQVERIEAFQEEFKRRKLKTPDQLPDVAYPSMILIWDMDEDDTVIRYGEREIWRERACYEGYERFGEVVNLLIAKYGTRVEDLIPARRSELYLYGDYLSAPKKVEEYRKKFFNLWADTWMHR